MKGMPFSTAWDRRQIAGNMHPVVPATGSGLTGAIFLMTVRHESKTSCKKNNITGKFPGLCGDFQTMTVEKAVTVKKSSQQLQSVGSGSGQIFIGNELVMSAMPAQTQLVQYFKERIFRSLCNNSIVCRHIPVIFGNTD